MKRGRTGFFVFLFVVVFGSECQTFAHQAVNFHGTIRISGLHEEIVEPVKGVADIVRWGHEETNGNFDEAILKFELVSEESECGVLLEAGTATVSSYRENKYSVTSKKFPLDLCEDGMADVIERILNKYGKTVQDALGLEECFSIANGSGITESGKTLRFANAYISKGKAVITGSSVKISFKISPALITYDVGNLNRKEYPLKIAGEVNIQREGAHQN